MISTYYATTDVTHTRADRISSHMQLRIHDFQKGDGDARNICMNADLTGQLSIP